MPRKLPDIDLAAVKSIADAEGLDVPETARLLLSYATYRWRAGYRGALGADDLSIKLLSGGIDAVKAIADQEKLAWNAAAAHLLAFAVAEWEPGWRKANPGPPSSAGVHQRIPAPTPAGPRGFDTALYQRTLDGYRSSGKLSA